MEPHDAARERRFSAAGLADQGERLAAADLELTSLTACTFSRDRVKRPPLFTGNSFTTRSSETSGSPGRAETCGALRRSPLRSPP